MLPDLNHIVNELAIYNPMIIIKMAEHYEINRVRFFENHSQIFMADVLYILNASTFFQLENPKGNFLCYSDHQINVEPLYQCNSNFIVIHDCLDINLIYQKITSLLNAFKVYQKTVSCIFKLQYQQAGIQKILNRASQYLQAPLILDDIGIRQIAIASDKELDAKTMGLFDSMYSHEYFDQIDQKYNQTGMFEPLYHQKNLVHLDQEGYPPYFMAGVFIENEVVAALTAFEIEKEFSELEKEFITLLTQILSIELKRDYEKIFPRKPGLELLLSDLLNEKIKNLIDKKNAENKLVNNLKTHKIIIVSQIPETEKYNITLEYLYNEFKGRFNNSFTVIINKNVVTLLSYDQPSDDSIKPIWDFLTKHRLYAGISRIFSNIDELSLSYEQALKAIELGTQKKHCQNLFFYNSYVIPHFLDLCSAPNDLKIYCHQVLLSMLAFDEEYATEYTSFLYHYLKNDMSQVKTAKFLKLNRHTISYRLEKISKQFDIDFENAELVFRLRLSFKILEHYQDTFASLK